MIEMTTSISPGTRSPRLTSCVDLFSGEHISTSPKQKEMMANLSKGKMASQASLFGNEYGTANTQATATSLVFSQPHGAESSSVADLVDSSNSIVDQIPGSHPAKSMSAQPGPSTNRNHVSQSVTTYNTNLSESSKGSAPQLALLGSLPVVACSSISIIEELHTSGPESTSLKRSTFNDDHLQPPKQHNRTDGINEIDIASSAVSIQLLDKTPNGTVTSALPSPALDQQGGTASSLLTSLGSPNRSSRGESCDVKIHTADASLATTSSCASFQSNTTFSLSPSNTSGLVDCPKERGLSKLTSPQKPPAMAGRSLRKRKLQEPELSGYLEEITKPLTDNERRHFLGWTELESDPVCSHLYLHVS